MNKTLKQSALVIMALLAVGCAGAPTKGDKMLSHSQDAEDIGELWNDGSKMVEAGKKLRDKGEDQVDDGQANIKKGERMIKKGQRMMEQSEKLYSERFPSESL